MNNLTSLFPPNYKNLEQKDAVKLLEEIEKVVEEQDNQLDNQLEIVCEELKKVNAENRDLKHKLENGTIVELPCKAGSLVYEDYGDDGVECGKVISFDISINCDTGIFELSDFGYRIFASEEDAKNNTEINSHE